MSSERERERDEKASNVNQHEMMMPVEVHCSPAAFTPSAAAAAAATSESGLKKVHDERNLRKTFLFFTFIYKLLLSLSFSRRKKSSKRAKIARLVCGKSSSSVGGKKWILVARDEISEFCAHKIRRFRCARYLNFALC